MAEISIAVVVTYMTATMVAKRIALAGFPLPPEERRIGCVDGLRGYLALSVMIVHAIIWTSVTRFGTDWLPPTVNALNQLGAGSVGIFFMVTGLVFYPKIRSGFQKTSWPVVYVGRIFRLAPLQFASVLAVILVAAFFTRLPPDGSFPKALAKWMSGRAEPPLLGYADSGRLNAFVLWSLWYEWLFYLIVLPLCAWCVDVIRDWLPPIAVPIAVLLLGLCAWFFDWAPMLRYLPLFAVGMIAFECQLRTRVRVMLCSRGATLAAALSLLIGINVANHPFTITVLPLFAFFFVCIVCGNSFSGLLTTRAALVLGEISFGIYLLHGFILFAIFHFGDDILSAMSPGIAIILVLGCSALLVVAIASLAHLVVELPGIQIGRQLARIWSARAARRMQGACNRSG